MSTRPPYAEIQRRERAALVDQLSELTPEQWRTPSLCAAWDVEEVVAHLVAAAATSICPPRRAPRGWGSCWSMPRTYAARSA